LPGSHKIGVGHHLDRVANGGPDGENTGVQGQKALINSSLGKAVGKRKRYKSHVGKWNKGDRLKRKSNPLRSVQNKR